MTALVQKRTGTNHLQRIRLKNSKVAGKDRIAAELIKMGLEKMAIGLHRLEFKIWKTEQLVEKWKEHTKCFQLKKDQQ